jgi:hypothetical protein
VAWRIEDWKKALLENWSLLFCWITAQINRKIKNKKLSYVISTISGKGTWDFFTLCFHFLENPEFWLLW